MPITIDLADCEMYKDGLLEGERRGLLEGIEGMLEIKYADEGLRLMGSVRRLEGLKDLIKKSASVEELTTFFL
ncbi:MAG: hypothetical protein HQL06_08610 [Nitrospirae bacterium]|nr:hypothetical protein [Nitrospirota bacterium]